MTYKMKHELTEKIWKTDRIDLTNKIIIDWLEKKAGEIQEFYNLGGGTYKKILGLKEKTLAEKFAETTVEDKSFGTLQVVNMEDAKLLAQIAEDHFKDKS